MKEVQLNLEFCEESSLALTQASPGRMDWVATAIRMAAANFSAIQLRVAPHGIANSYDCS